MELDIILEKDDVKYLEFFCNKKMKGLISDLEWREYQLNTILDLENDKPLKMNGYKTTSDDYMTYIFTANMLMGCMGDDDIETNLKSVTHIIEWIRIKSEKATALVKVLNTPCGKAVNILLENDIKLRLIPKFITNTKEIYRIDII